MLLSYGGRGGRRTSGRRELPGRLDPVPARAAAARPGALLLRAARRRARRLVRRRPPRGARRARAAGCAHIRRARRLARASQRPADRARVRPPARAVPAADRGEPDRPARRRVRDLGGREAVLRPLRRPVRAARPRRPAPARRRRARGRERLRVHGPPARQLPPGRASRPRARPRVPAGGGSARASATPPSTDRATSSARCFASRRSARPPLLQAGDVLRARIGGRLGRAVGLFARGGLAALDALEAAHWDVFTQRPKPSRARLAREAALVLVR